MQREEKWRRSILWMKREKFLYAIPVDTEGQLQYRITFPVEGTYKIWGDFYINGKKYEKEFIVQVQRKTANYLAVFLLQRAL